MYVIPLESGQYAVVDRGAIISTFETEKSANDYINIPQENNK